MDRQCAGVRVALLVEDGFEEIELTAPREALLATGAVPLIVSPRPQMVRAWHHTDWGDRLPVDVPLEVAQAGDFDALILPGGVINPDRLRLNRAAVRFVAAFAAADKPIAAICHAPQILIEAGLVRGRRLTSFPSVRTDLVNAGAHWVDEPVVVDRNLITSRTPQDLEQFNKVLVHELAGLQHVR